MVCGEREPVRLPAPGASDLAVSPRHPAVQALVWAAERGAVPLPAAASAMIADIIAKLETELAGDVGSVQAVLNTNVPPSVANYRKRVGRAGWRG